MKEKISKRLNNLFEALSITSEGCYVYVYDIKNNISRWSDTAVNYYGLPGRYISSPNKMWIDHIHPDDIATYKSSIKGVFSGELANHDVQYRVRDASGSYSVCTCKGTVIWDDDDNAEYFCGIIRNHNHLNHIDQVTGFRNLYGFLDDVKGVKFSPQPLLIIMIGLSAFSNINDLFGYTFGNRTLQLFSRKIIEMYPSESVIYKMDGTRFAIITNNCTIEEAERIYNELNTYLRTDFFVDGQRIVLSLNGGAIISEEFDVSSQAYYSCLRYAYYQSKHKKCGSFVVFDNIVNADNRGFIRRINIIRNSIAEGCKGFYLCYQPIVDSATEKINGVESLIRWKSDELGTISPGDFIPVLEQDALFPELGKWILRQAMTDGMKFLEKNPDMTVSVNLSYTQIEKNGFVNDLFEIIEQTGFPSDHLCLEVTERCRTLDMGLLKNMFSDFRNKGIKIAVDDFGTGFASLDFLRAVPVDVVKIDREYVKNIKTNITDKSSVQFISDLAGAFSANVCAEGIETDEIRLCVREYNKIGSLQGYYYSRPVTAEEILKKLDE
ncbi:MAG: EAL domain-containing protein [Ruminococcus sp.]|nr:EAL domain-containing protein [Ruminococcus sp.]